MEIWELQPGMVVEKDGYWYIFKGYTADKQMIFEREDVVTCEHLPQNQHEDTCRKCKQRIIAQGWRLPHER